MDLSVEELAGGALCVALQGRLGDSLREAQEQRAAFEAEAALNASHARARHEEATARNAQLLERLTIKRGRVQDEVHTLLHVHSTPQKQPHGRPYVACAQELEAYDLV
jgi:hypothetical protein